MNQLNYHHLYYFWTAARTGGVAAAARELFISQPTISTQIKTLETALGQKLFRRAGRGLVLTEKGQLVFDYADEIFSIGRELVDVLSTDSTGRRARLVVGITDALPKLVAHDILSPALDSDLAVRLIVREGKLEDLLAELSVHRLDIVLTDVPAPPNLNVRVFHHELGASPLTFLARPKLARRLRRRFPASLDRAPMVLPTENTAMRRSLERWFDQQGVRPEVVAEVEDSALLKVLAAERDVVIPVCSLIAEKTKVRYGLAMLGTADGCVERFYAISAERRLKNRAVRAITEAARGAMLDQNDTSVLSK